jgi:hypothetical protein
VPVLSLNERVWTPEPIARQISLTMMVMDNLRCRCLGGAFHPGYDLLKRFDFRHSLHAEPLKIT